MWNLQKRSSLPWWVARTSPPGVCDLRSLWDFTLPPTRRWRGPHCPRILSVAMGLALATRLSRKDADMWKAFPRQLTPVLQP